MLARDLLLVEIAPAAVPGDPYHIPPPPGPPILASGAPLPIGVVSAVPKNAAFTLQMAVANSLGQPTWSATGMPPGTSIDPATALISGAGTAQGDYYPTITADDTANGGTVTTTVIRISIGASFSLIGSLKQATRNTTYRSGILQVGATGTVTWSATGLPTGLSLASSASSDITGSTASLGTFNVTYTAADSGTGTSASITVPLVVNRLITAIALDGSLTVVPKILAGSTFATVATACNTSAAQLAGTQPITWTCSNQPVGMDIDEQTGIFGGETIADAAGSYVVTLTATDVWGQSFSRVVTFTVVNGIKALTPNQVVVGDSLGQAISANLLALYFGSGIDGDIVLDGTITPAWAIKSGSTYTLTRDVYPHNLTINSGVVLDCAAFAPFGSGKLDLTNASVGAIVVRSKAGSNATATLGGQGGVSGYAATLGLGGAGAAGATGVTGVAAGGSSTTDLPVANGGVPSGISTNAGKGGAGTAGAGSAAGTPGQIDAVAGYPFPIGLPLTAQGAIRGGVGAPGGGAGAGDGTNKGGSGGGGGEGGHDLLLAFNEIVTGPSTPAGAIKIVAGVGGTGFSVTLTNVGAGGGGWGGGGGYGHIRYAIRTGTAIVGLIWADGANGANAGTNSANATRNGIGGDAGHGGTIELVNVLTGAVTVVRETVAPTVVSGVTGATGGQTRATL